MNIDWQVLTEIGMTLLLMVILVIFIFWFVAFLEWIKEMLKTKYNLDVDYLLNKIIWIIAMVGLYIIVNNWLY